MLAALLLAVTFHPLAIPAMAGESACDWKRMRTHIEVTGFVTYVKVEGDGDLHIRLCDSAKVKGMNRERCIVAECIPALPCTRPRVGTRATVRGVTRYDGERGHGWWEVHPVLALEEG